MGPTMVVGPVVVENALGMLLVLDDNLVEDPARIEFWRTTGSTNTTREPYAGPSDLSPGGRSTLRVSGRRLSREFAGPREVATRRRTAGAHQPDWSPGARHMSESKL